MATKSYIGIRNEASSKTLDLHFTDYIYDGFDWENWEYKNLVQDTISSIKAAKPEKINVTINSLGGDVMIGLALYNFLKAYDAEINVEIIGFAASIASIIAMSADKGKLKMAKNAFMIVHAAWSGAVGNAKEMREQADNLDKVTNNLAEIYADRSGKKASDFTEMWADGDKWLDGAEALELGLVDELLNTEPVQAKVKVTDFSFKNIPERFINQANEEPEEKKSFFNSLKSDIMSFINSLTTGANAAKVDPKFAAVSNKEEILEFVQAALNPLLAELEAAKPVEAAKTETEEVKPAEVVAEKPAELSAEAKKIAELEASLEAQKKQMNALIEAQALNASNPETGKGTDSKVLAAQSVAIAEYEN